MDQATNGVGMFALVLGVVFFMILIVYTIKEQRRLKHAEKPKTPGKRTKTVQSVKKKMKLGKTYINLVFENGEEFTTCVYGAARHWYDEGKDADHSGPIKEPKLYDVAPANSLECARGFISELHGNRMTYTDDPSKPTKSILGVAVKAEISTTYEDEEVEVTLYEIVDRKD